MGHVHAKRFGVWNRYGTGMERGMERGMARTGPQTEIFLNPS